MKCDDKCKIGLIVLGVIIVISIIITLVCISKTEIANELDQKYINSYKVKFITTPNCSFEKSCTGINSKCYKLYTTKLQLTVYVDVKSLVSDLNKKVKGDYGSNEKITYDISSANNSDCRSIAKIKNKENISYTDNNDIIPKINLYEDECYIKGLSKLSISLTNKNDYKKN